MVRLGTARNLMICVLTVGVFIGVLAGCAQPLIPGATSDGLPLGGGTRDSIGALGSDCESRGDTPPELVVLPGDAVLVSARRCLFEGKLIPGEGEWSMRVEQEATAGLAALAAALRLPDEPSTRGQACPAIGYAPIVITVTDSSGRQIHPKVPQTTCGAPMQEAVDAIAALPWTTVATTKAQQIRSELEVTSGCSGSWKPEIALTAIDGSGTQTMTLDTRDRPMQVCRYEPDSDPTNVITLNDGRPYRIGVLVSVSTLDSTAGGQLLTAVAAAPAVTGTCAQQEQPFAVVYPSNGGGPYLTIELAGCYRALGDGENWLRQLDAATVAGLVG